MTDRPNILTIVGSLRAGSVNRRLAEAIADRGAPHASFELFELNDIPLYDGDLESAGDPPGVERLKKALEEADAVLIVTPEYNGGLPGVVKNALDWASRPPRPLRGMPLASTGATPGRWGTAKAQAEMQRLGRHLGMLVWPGPDLLVPDARKAFDASGSLVDEELGERVDRFIRGFVAWIDRVGARDMAEAA